MRLQEKRTLSQWRRSEVLGTTDMKYLIEYFTPLTLGEEHQGDLSDEDVTEVWLTVKSEAIKKVRRTKDGEKGEEVHCPDEKEMEKTF